MVGKASSESSGVPVCVRAAVSATQPLAKPAAANGFFSTAPETCRTVASDRIGEMTLSLRPISSSTCGGTR